MKRLIAAAVLLLLTVGIGVCTTVIVSRETDTLITEIEELRQGDTRPELVLEQWEEAEKKLAYFMSHSELTMTARAITELCASDSPHDEAYKIAELYLNALKESETVSFSNII